MATEQETYNIGFTAGAAMLNEMRAVAEAFLDCGGDWEKTKDKTFKENLMEKDKMSSNVRYFAASALGESPVEFHDETSGTTLIGPASGQVHPVRVTEPLLWALHNVAPSLIPSSQT